MATTISGTYPNVLTLALPSTNPTTFTSTARLNGGVAAYYANQTVVNAGRINASGNAGGIALAAGGFVTNQSGGVINGYYGINGRGGTLTVVNAATIVGANTGVYLFAGNATQTTSITNQSGAIIRAGIVGVATQGAPASVTNAGSIVSSSGTGISLYAGGTITNQKSAAVVGGIRGGGMLSVLNAGTVTAGAGYGVALGAGGSVTNQSGGVIRSGIDGIYSQAGGGTVTIVNAGSISGGTVKANQAGVFLAGSAMVTNQAKSVISGHDGIYGSSGTTTVTNAGTITGVIGIDFAPAASGNQTVVNTGTIIGTGGIAVAFGGTGHNLLVMNSGSSLKGTAIGSASAANTVQLVGAVGAPVVATYSSHGMVNFQTVSFGAITGNSATLAIATLTTLPTMIMGFTDPLETIDLLALSNASKNAVASFDDVTDILTVTAGPKSVSLQLDNEAYTGVHFVAQTGSLGGTEVQPLRSPTVTSVTTSPTTGKLGAGKIVTFTVNFSTTVTVQGGTPTLLLNDGGSAKYSGGSGKSALTFAYTVAAGDVTPDLAITGAALNGATIIHGIGNPADLTGAVTNPAGTLQIDAAVPPTNVFLLIDTDTKASTPAAIGNPYTGSAAGVLHQYNPTTSHSVSISTTTPGWSFQTGAGNDAINVSQGGGSNILDGGGGSNFLVGGTGNDMFFLDGRNPKAAIWNTIVGFHPGDTATIWGLSASDFTITHADNQGAVGYKGLTYAFSPKSGPQENITIAGYTYAKVQSNHLTISYGTGSPSSGAPGSPYMMLRAS